ncbi:MAG TPA: cyanophycinase [Herpetosiphonaceae bacterium]|nr:cyanophycinase [Herpetosiphonaceae bacterium]
MPTQAKGRLIIIGGHEDRDPEGERTILKEVASAATKSNNRMVLITVATEMPGQVADEYATAFRSLDIELEPLDIRSREDACDEANVRKIERAAAIFFTGGDQLRITSQIGDSPSFRCIRERYHAGATVVGTSAGAAAMSGTMIVGGTSDSSFRIGALDMAPGLNFLPDSVVDSHFAERGRIGRLAGAVAQNPRNLGLGIDEDTAIVVEREKRFRVIGSGAVYVVDGSTISYSNLAEQHADDIVTIHAARVHILGQGSAFDLSERLPIEPADSGR